MRFNEKAARNVYDWSLRVARLLDVREIELQASQNQRGQFPLNFRGAMQIVTAFLEREDLEANAMSSTLAIRASTTSVGPR